LAKALLELMGKPNHPINIMGTRHGEKLYEALLGREEMACAQDMGDYYRVPPDGRDLNYTKFVEQGGSKADANWPWRRLQQPQYPTPERRRHEKTAAEAALCAAHCSGGNTQALKTIKRHVQRTHHRG
jgi:FlaA1/EpsC-like NDP-sugar epimerase